MIDRTEPVTGVLVGVDGDPATSGAVTWAAREAARRGLTLDLVQVLPSADHEATLRAPTGRAHALLDEARRRAERVAPDVPIRLSEVDGAVGPALVRSAEHAALLVLGTRGAVIDINTTVGRTVAHVLGHAACPVVVVPPTARHDGDGREVLVGVDGSPDAIAAVAFAAEVADHRKAPLVALGVAPRFGASDNEDRWRRVLAESVAGVPETYPDLRVSEELSWGTAAQEIVRRAGGAHLIVLGSRGRGALSGALLGSTSQAVVSRASCPVAVLSPRAAAIARTRAPGAAAGRPS